VARALGKLPAIDTALKAGLLSYAKVRALTRVATPATEAKLLDVALAATGAQLERLCRGYRTAIAPDEALPAPERSVRKRELSSRVGSRRALLGADHRGKVWKPSQGFHFSRVGSRRALLGADHRGKVWKPSQGFHFSRVGSRRALFGADHRGKVWKPSQGFHFSFSGMVKLEMVLSADEADLVLRARRQAGTSMIVRCSCSGIVGTPYERLNGWLGGAAVAGNASAVPNTPLRRSSLVDVPQPRADRTECRVRT
jgi:hypothetical protein